MSGIGIVLLVFFVIVAILLILLVLIQNDEGDGLGGMFGGGSSTAFGSRSGNVLTRTTTVLGILFLVISLSMALVNRSSTGNVERAGQLQTIESEGAHWSESHWSEQDGTSSITPIPEPDSFDYANDAIDTGDEPGTDQ